MQPDRATCGETASCSCGSALADMLNICGPNYELKSIKHLISKVLHTVMPKPESLIYSPELRSSANAIQSKKSTAMLPREFACVAKKGVRDIAPLLVRVDSNLVNVC